MISALTHGNEICGAHALAFLFEANIRPLRGRLTLLFASVAAHAAGRPARPEPARYLDEDFNRLWSESILQGPRQSRELARARALKTVIDSADYLLDLHSMQDPGLALALTGVTEKGKRLAAAMGYPEYLIADAGHAAGPRMRDYGDFALAESAKTALLIECGQHAEPMAKEVAIESALRFLAALGMIAPETLHRLSRHGAPERQRRIAVTAAVTVRDESFAFAARYLCLDIVPKARHDDRKGRRAARPHPLRRLRPRDAGRGAAAGRDRRSPRPFSRLSRTAGGQGPCHARGGAAT